jgi:catechol 2,3-dioxygenase-like lactoylglutathione lyase family enzyme
MSDSPAAAPRVVAVAYPSLYVDDFDAAVAFWTGLLGPPAYSEPEGAGRLVGFRLGDTWLTLFPRAGGPHPDSGPRGCEFALKVGAPGDVDGLFARMLALGATAVMAPRDTRMYEAMRFACVDTPHGVRIDVVCPA